VALASGAGIISVTGISPENLDMAKELGARVPMTRPVSPCNLEESVREALGPFVR
jgi:hypothetical protein